MDTPHGRHQIDSTLSVSGRGERALCVPSLLVTRYSLLPRFFDVLDERADHDTRPTLRCIGAVLGGRGAPGDIEVDPRLPLDELADEQGRRDRAAAAPARALHIRDVTLQLVPVFVPGW